MPVNLCGALFGSVRPWYLVLVAGTLLAFSLALISPSRAGEPSAEADRAWQVILQQASGPGNRFHSQDEVIAAARQHLEKQEAALVEFERKYPDDPRHYSAQIRRATVLAAKARLTHQPASLTAALKILTDLEGDPATPTPIKSDAGFARISQSMESASGHPDDAARDGLLKAIRQFDADYPADRRTPNLLTELATVYDDQPTQKKALLEEAVGRAKDEGTRQRISDDLKRIALLGHPLNLRLLPWQGGPALDLTASRGRAVVILFWASWSLPALHELASLEETSAHFEGQPVDFLTVSLDEDRAALGATIKLAQLKWPVHCDGAGWRGELVRSLGINALPTVWVLDRKGVLLTLNARDKAADLIRQALADAPASEPPKP